MVGVSIELRMVHTVQFHGSLSPVRLLRVSRCVIKSYFFNMVQPIDQTFCKTIKIIKQSFLSSANFLGPNFLFLAR